MSGRARRLCTRAVTSLAAISIIIALVAAVRSTGFPGRDSGTNASSGHPIRSAEKHNLSSINDIHHDATTAPHASDLANPAAPTAAPKMVSAGPIVPVGPLPPNTIRFRSRTFTPTPSVSVPAPAQPGLTHRHYLVQYAKGAERTIKSVLAQRGIQVLQAVPPNAVAVSAPLDASLEGLDGVRAAFALSPQDRLSQPAAEMVAQAPEANSPLPMFVEFFSDVTATEATATLSALGVHSGPQPLNLPGHVVLTHVQANLVQSVSEVETVAWIIPATEALMTKDQVFYCLGAETATGNVANYVVGSDGWDGPGLGSASLTYHWDTVVGEPINSTFPQADLKAQIVQALTTWSKYVQVSFSESAVNTTRCFNIYAGTGAHNCDFPFQQGVLAHCFYPPPNPETIAGDLHLNNAYSWKIGQDYDIFSVALHEAGHGLGLDHSADPTAVMYPTYHGVVTDLAQDDINGIRQIYATQVAGPAAPTGLAPAGGTQVNSSVTFSWNAVSGATSYSVWLGKGTAASYQYVTTLSTANTSVNYTPSADGPYVWWVRATNSQGTGPWSAAAEFSFSGTSTPLPSKIVGLNPNGSSLPGPSVTFQWSADPNATAYTIWIGKGTPATYTYYVSQNVATNSATISLADIAGYVWWVRGSNSAGNGPWSDPATVTTTGAALTAPQNLSPSGGAVVNNALVTFAWGAVSGATMGYDVWVGAGTPASYQYSGGVNSWQGGTTWSYTLPASGSYVWWVRARGSGGAVGPWSAAAAFSYAPPAPPAPPAKITGLSPNGAVYAAGTTSVNLSWTADGSATAYTVWVGTGTPASYTFFASMTVSSPAAVVNLGASGPYVWWVRGQNAAGNGPWSDAATFSVNAAGLAAPQNLAPAGGAVVYNNQVTLTWNAVSGAAQYDVWVGTGTAAGYQYYAGGSGSGTSGVLILAAPGPYVWWVRARNGSTVGPWSAAAQFSYSNP